MYVIDPLQYLNFIGFIFFDMLQILSRARRWYTDGTFKVVREPFCQLLSIHASLTHDGATKQVPLAFCFISRPRIKTYA